MIITRDRAPSEAPADTAADETEFHRPRRQSVGYQEDQQDIAFLRWQRHKQMHALQNQKCASIWHGALCTSGSGGGGGGDANCWTMTGWG